MCRFDRQSILSENASFSARPHMRERCHSVLKPIFPVPRPPLPTTFPTHHHHCNETTVFTFSAELPLSRCFFSPCSDGPSPKGRCRQPHSRPSGVRPRRYPRPPQPPLEGPPLTHQASGPPNILSSTIISSFIIFF